MTKARRKKGVLPRWLQHRRLIVVEATLAAGLAEEWAQNWLLRQSTIPWWARTLAVMAMFLGLLALVVAIIRNAARQGAATVSQVASLTFIPRLLVHAALLALLFYGYAQTFGLWRW